MWLLSGYIFIQLVLGISSQECRTSNNKDVKWYQTNKPCIFPFKHGEKTHNTCADLLLSGKVRTNMCATKVDSRGVIKGTGKCGPNCPTKVEKLDPSTYYDFRQNLLYNGAGKNSGQYLWDDGDEDQCGVGFCKYFKCI